MRKNKISILGMGYVGIITAVTLAKQGYKSICTDILIEKVESLNKGIPPLYEPGLEALVKELTKNNVLLGSTNNIDSIKNSDITFICVGTPTLPKNSIDLTAIKTVSKNIGEALQDKDGYHLVVVKSTVIPGTCEDIIIPTIEKYSRKKVGCDFGFCINPEFLRQGSAIKDSFNPDRIVIGEFDKKSGNLLLSINQNFTCPKMICDIKTAEMIKYASNSFLATKISFANEFSRICEKLNIDVYEVMKGVGLDHRINPLFLKAGCGFGGSCLPKDLKALIAKSKELNVKTPLLNSVLLNNELQPMHCIDLMRNVVGTFQEKVVAFLGLSYKPNTDDVRETRALPIIKKLFDEGAYIKAYDPKAIENFKQSTNIPCKYVHTWEEALKDAHFAVIQSDWEEIRNIKSNVFKKLMKNPIIIDCRRSYNPEELIRKGITYIGIGWKNKVNLK
ncbi:MAG: UDP-glucose dehydrogenase family protein [Candidatus Hodarchaeota archaeon]